MHGKFGVRLAGAFGVSTILISCFTITLFYRQAVGSIRREVEIRTLEVAASAANLVDSDKHLRIRKRADQDGPAYRAIAQKLSQFLHASPDIRHIYTLVRADVPDRFIYVIDVGKRPPIRAFVGSPWMPTPDRAVRRALATGKPSLSRAVRIDQWGRYRNCFAPVRDSRGRIVAILGMDVSVDSALQRERSIMYGAVLSFLTAALLALIFSAVLSARITRPIEHLTAAIHDIAEGNLDCKIEINSSDEFGSLAASFNTMVASLKESRNVLMERANTDGLTGLYNHRYFHERLSQELKRAIRYGHPLSLFMIDLDGFKAVNDRMGHPAGDMILRNVAKIILSNVRETDICVRYGGDEFAVILPETDLDEALALAERVRRVVDSDPTLSVGQEGEGGGAHWKITLSIGAAECPRHARQRDALVAAADISMYHAKSISENRVCSYDEVPGAGGLMDPCKIHAFLQSASVSTIAALAEAVDAKDHYTHGHSEAVARYAAGIADQLRLSPEDKFNVRIAAMLHDIGKIGMPDTILKNPGDLSTEQRDIVHSHPLVGERIVKQVPQLQKILPGILYHHERYDGTGYPSGLKGQQIPLIARIICVADAFDAMTSDRPYRKALPVNEALQELRKGAGAQFDPKLIEAFAQWARTALPKAA